MKLRWILLVFVLLLPMAIGDHPEGSSKGQDSPASAEESQEQDSSGSTGGLVVAEKDVRNGSLLDLITGSVSSLTGKAARAAQERPTVAVTFAVLFIVAMNLSVWAYFMRRRILKGQPQETGGARQPEGAQPAQPRLPLLRERQRKRGRTPRRPFKGAETSASPKHL